MNKSKRGICMADGGITQETPDQLMARMTAKYGAPAAGPTTQQTGNVAQPKQAQPKPAAMQPASTGQGILGILSGRKDAIDKASNYANGGIVRGKGTPTSDDVPVTVRGKQYNFSDTEAVLPSKTRQALGEMLGAKPGDVAQANALVEQFIEKTNGKPPVSVEEGTNLAAGGLLDDEAKRVDYQAVTGIAAPSPIPTPITSAVSSGGVSLGRSPAPTIYENGGLPAEVVQNGIDTMRGQLAKPQRPAPAATGSEAVQSIASPPIRPWYAGSSTADDRTGLEMERDRRAQASSAGVLADPVKSALQYGVIGQAVQAPTTQPPASTMASTSPNSTTSAIKTDPFGAKPERFATPANSDGTFMTGKAQYDESGLNKTGVATPDSSGGGFTQKGISYNVNPSEQEGITKITSSRTNPLFTNIKPEDAVSGLKNQAVGAQDVQEGLDRHARANAVWQSVIDKQPQGGVGILGDGGIAADNAEKTARWRQDDLLQQAKYGNRAAGDAIQANAHLAGESMRSTTAMRGQDVGAGITARGQDLTAQTEANRLAGNPLDNQLKQAQTQGILAQTDSAKMLTEIQRKALAGDAQAEASYRALTGKAVDYKDRYTVVPGGDYIDPDNPLQKMRSKPQILDNATGKMLQTDAQQQGQAQVPAADKREIGKTYQTPKGPMVWRGNGWEAA